MKLLHTSDWHLGHKLINQERRKEHQHALDWLLETLLTEQIDILIIAGDVFDTANPPNYALRQYYQFLAAAAETQCQQIIIIGGNHDSPALLEAAQPVLEKQCIQVVGCSARQADGEVDFKRQVFPVTDKQDKLIAVIGAMPYLRDRDLKYAKAGESATEREQSLRQGIHQHYAAICQAMHEHGHSVPHIATGHLFAAGALTSDSEQAIHVGNLGQVGADCFPAQLDYVALGHLHRTQRIAKQDRLRYCGALIPLGFAEAENRSQVLIAEFDGAQLTVVREIEVPRTRRLLRLQGDLEQVLQLINDFPPLASTEFPAWLEITLNQSEAMAEQQLSACCQTQNLHILKLLVQQNAETALTAIAPGLDDLQPLDVFLKKCEDSAKTAEETAQLQDLFQILHTQVLEAESDRQ
ncbi:exonuclease SbcCD subunit D C-terminal domain-containing protein [Candidatus Venteria ishoeyi]|uniref:exonuclease SbcCD subunit D C-terminal domain-containing protein n=1 Tax=Candidatus Venteria ishoeyi TaxID=1899563 RepID=UPI0025A623D1|nr:exonuclease SbcCD subunit D C-terminal domain-containing protein [Candidatus Venteria ishoeyi]MDM8546662.1 exonuclease SbcCD subunit D C-terminal domain-containing protein [Candidatus Venteria ishoeyi]